MSNNNFSLPTTNFDRALIDLIADEMKVINRLLAEHNINGGVTPSDTHITPAYILYDLTLGKGVKATSVVKLRQELSTAITRLRGERTLVRFEDIPPAIEVPHPHPYPLLLQEQTLDLPAHTFLLGISYSQGQAYLETIHFRDLVHCLVVGQTGSGKSVFLTGSLLASCQYTPPEELRLHLVDLKNADAVPLKPLPHVHTFAGSLDKAEQVIADLHTLLHERIQAQDPNPLPREVLVVDEAQLLAKSKQIIAKTEEIISLGRSMNIHIISATQHPLERVVSSVLKANYPHRFVGAVTTKEASKVATGRGGVGAELLPGKGAFVKIAGGSVTRFQTFFIDPADVDAYVQRIIDLYPGWQPTEAADIITSSPEPSTVPGDDRIVALARKKAVQETFTQYFDPEQQELKYGGIGHMITAIFGARASRGGGNYYTAQYVIDYLIEQVR